MEQNHKKLGKIHKSSLMAQFILKNTRKYHDFNKLGQDFDHF